MGFSDEHGGAALMVGNLRGFSKRNGSVDGPD